MKVVGNPLNQSFIYDPKIRSFVFQYCWQNRFLYQISDYSSDLEFRGQHKIAAITCFWVLTGVQNVHVFQTLKMSQNFIFFVLTWIFYVSVTQCTIVLGHPFLFSLKLSTFYNTQLDIAFTMQPGCINYCWNAKFCYSFSLYFSYMFKTNYVWFLFSFSVQFNFSSIICVT